jgi:hypothetical protein
MGVVAGHGLGKDQDALIKFEIPIGIQISF